MQWKEATIKIRGIVHILLHLCKWLFERKLSKYFVGAKKSERKREVDRKRAHFSRLHSSTLYSFSHFFLIFSFAHGAMHTHSWPCLHFYCRTSKSFNHLENLTELVTLHRRFLNDVMTSTQHDTLYCEAIFTIENRINECTHLHFDATQHTAALGSTHKCNGEFPLFATNCRWLLIIYVCCRVSFHSPSFRPKCYKICHAKTMKRVYILFSLKIDRFWITNTSKKKTGSMANQSISLLNYAKWENANLAICLFFVAC